MRIDSVYLKCVCFIGYKMGDGSYRMAGSAFMITEFTKNHLVTAKHVVDGIRRLGLDKIWYRVNTINNSSKWIETAIENWMCHPTDKSIDVSIASFDFSEDFDHRVLYKGGVTQERIEKRGVAAGDSIFITGLFRHHHGEKRNIPIARHGNLACLNEEKVVTRVGEMDAHLIEVRSIGGLSGSPVFLNLGPIEDHNGNVVDEIKVLGLIHGHFDLQAKTVDSMVEDFGSEGTVTHINTGIAIVVPYPKIQELLDYIKMKLQ